MSWQIDMCDPQKTLDAADFFYVLTEVTNIVEEVMRRDSRFELDEEDRAFIMRRVQTMVQPGPGASEAMIVKESERKKNVEGSTPTPFQRFDHVVCRPDREHLWLAGVVREYVHAIDEDGPENHGQARRYVHVMIDAPDNRLLAVPEDECHLQRAAACDGLMCCRIPPPADPDRGTGLKRKRTHILTYLGRVLAVSPDPER